MIGITYILLAVIVLVVLIDLYFKRKNKLATTKDIEKLVDKENPDKKGFNKPIAIITATLLILIGLFFTVNHLKYDGRLTDTDDGISFIQNITLDKIKYADIVNNGEQYFNKSTMQPISGIIVDSIPCNSCSNRITVFRGVTQVHCEWHPRMDGLIINGLKQGKFRYWHKNGQIYLEHEYLKGVIVGVEKVWNENGQLISEVTYNSRNESGLYDVSGREWYENGQLKAEGSCRDACNIIYGINRAWYRNGKLMYEVNWGKGLQQTPDGLARRFYSNGQLWAQATYKGGKLNGLARVWNKNGKGH